MNIYFLNLFFNFWDILPLQFGDCDRIEGVGIERADNSVVVETVARATLLPIKMPKDTEPIYAYRFHRLIIL